MITLIAINALRHSQLSAAKLLLSAACLDTLLFTLSINL